MTSVYENRRLLWLLVMRDLKLRYAGAFLGYIWSVLEPLLMAGVYWLVFTQIFKARQIGEQPYILFLVTGLFAWNWFAGAVTAGCGALSAEATMVRTTKTPREIWVARVTISKMMEYIYSLPVIIFFAVLYRHPVTWFILLYPLAMLLQLLLSYGIALMVAPLTVIAADVTRIVKIVLRMGFYLTPVLWSLSNVQPGFLKDAVALNPMAGVMALYRAAFWPQDDPPWRYVGFSVATTIIMLILGSIVFRRLEGTVLKEI
jgi:ABC-2 type transport system permease protein